MLAKKKRNLAVKSNQPTSSYSKWDNFFPSFFFFKLKSDLFHLAIAEGCRSD